MLKIGIVGAENSHCPGTAKLCNVQKKINCRVVAVWGERPKFAKAAAEAGDIPTIVKDWRDMLGLVDGVMIDHRHAKYHAEVATFFVENGVPCFVDKPFTYTLAEGKKLCALAARKGVPITTFSTIAMQDDFKAFKKAVRKIGPVISLTTSGPVDLKSKWGGIFFYGIHQVDAIIDLLGTDVARVNVQKHGRDGLATLLYKDGPMVTMYCVKDGPYGFHWSAIGQKGTVDWTARFDTDAYLAGARVYTRMFRTGKEPYSRERMLAPVAVLEAMDRSLKQHKSVKVPDFRS
jgi:predicted dehydrogenase